MRDVFANKTLACAIFAILIIITIWSSGCVHAPEGSITVSELLQNPVYNEEFTVYGRVSNMGELFCPCFTLSYGGDKVDVWYDLMVEELIEWPAVSVEGIENGDWVLVTGELRVREGVQVRETFWARRVEKTGTNERTCEDRCGDGECQEIVCQAIGCPCSETHQTCPQDCPSAGLPNPAAVYCEQNGGVFQGIETPEGTAGYCSLPDGRVCEEWAFYRSNGTECNSPE